MDYQSMPLDKLKEDLTQDTLKGIPFLIAGSIYWFVMGILHFFIKDTQTLALIYLIGSGSIFPAAMLISKLIGANLVSKNPLGTLSGIIGGVQGFYILIWIVIYIELPNLLPLTIGILVGSHFLPYAWIYNSKAYQIFTMLTVLISFILGYVFKALAFTILPFALALIYLTTIIMLKGEYPNKKFS